MARKSRPAPDSVRARPPWLWLVVGGVIVTGTLGNAAANLFPHHVPSAAEAQRAEQDAVAQARRTLIASLIAVGDHCDALTARELARALVYDGRSALAYADDYTRRCGDDPIMDRWRAASVKLARKLR